jgi:hypothetical protein
MPKRHRSARNAVLADFRETSYPTFNTDYQFEINSPTKEFDMQKLAGKVALQDRNCRLLVSEINWLKLSFLCHKANLRPVVCQAPKILGLTDPFLDFPKVQRTIAREQLDQLLVGGRRVSLGSRISDVLI